VARPVQALFFILIALGLAGGVYADEERREALALEVMTIVGMPDVGAQVAASLLSQIKPAYPTVSDELWAEIAGAVSPDEIVQLSIAPYVKHFSAEELAAMIEFYESSLGRAVLTKMPAVQYETMMIGNEWGQRKLAEIVEKLKAAGHEPEGM
jgi:hypothetical protein